MVQTPSNRLKSHWLQNSSESTGNTSAEHEAQPRSEPANELAARFAYFLGERPAVTLAVGALAGLVLGWIVKRK